MAPTLVVFGMLLATTLGLRQNSTNEDDFDMDSFSIPNFSRDAALNNYFTEIFQQNKEQEEFIQRHGPFDIRVYSRNEPSTPEPMGPEDSWSILWYFASFSGLIVFFLVISCSEWCCRKHVRRANPLLVQPSQAPSPPQTSVLPETPPPAYDLFAPPSYESLAVAAAAASSRPHEKSEFDVYVVPVHALAQVLGSPDVRDGSDDEPPSYCAINMSYMPNGDEVNAQHVSS